MSKVHFVKDITRNFVCTSIPEMAELECTEMPCPHCGCEVRYPLIARQEDVERLEALMQEVCEVLDVDHGFLTKLMAKVRANIVSKLLEKKGVHVLDTESKRQ